MRALRGGAEAAPQQRAAASPGSSTLRTIGIGVAITVLSASLIGIAIRLFNIGGASNE